MAVDFSEKNYIEDFYNNNKHYYYSRFLGLIYFLFFESQLLGAIINIFFWFLSALFFYKILIHLNTSKSNINLALIFYSFFPTFFGTSFEIKNKEQLNDALHKMLNTENLAVYLIFTLVLIIALFNVVGSIIMMILDKKKDLKIS